jgi:hypothetical protein
MMSEISSTSSPARSRGFRGFVFGQVAGVSPEYISSGRKCGPGPALRCAGGSSRPATLFVDGISSGCGVLLLWTRER